MAGNSKAPPVLTEEGNYAQWKHQLRAWQLLTDVKEEKQGLSVYLHGLTGTFKEIVSKTSIEDLHKKGGVKTITDLLDRHCELQKSSRQYNIYEKMHRFKRNQTESVSASLIRFEAIVGEMVSLDMELPTTVLAYHVLTAMNIGGENERIARATVPDLTYENMVVQIKAIMETQPAAHVSDLNSSEIKIEPGEPDTSLYTSGSSWRGRGNRRGRANRYSLGNGAQAGGRKCYVCGSPDHLSYDCPKRNNVKGTDSNNASVSGGGRCFKCNSSEHFAYACPNSRGTGKTYSPQNVNIILLELLGKSDNVSKFVGETFGCAVVDSGAKSNVCGTVWLDRYIESISDGDRSAIREEHCVSKYRFGDGEEVLSDVKITVPVSIGSQKQLLTTSVINKDIPLLLSFDSLNRNSVVIDFGNLSMNVGNQSVPLKRTSSGHLLLPLSDKDESNVNIVLQVRNLENLSRRDKEKKMMKLHQQMAHASKESLMRLLVSSGIKDKELKESLIKVVDGCEICLKYKRRPLRPCVAESLSEGFNSTVAMDLKTYIKDRVYILHLICLGTKYSAARVIRGKARNTILKGVLMSWIHYFGPPRRFLTDNGGEFSNDDFKELCEQFNVLSITTPGESPWSNGVCERHNGVLMETVRRVMDECKCDIETALPWAVCAKNTLSNISGYSPNMLVFGKNPNEPSVLHDSIPALEPCSHSELVRSNMNIRSCAKKAFVGAESSEKIRRALRMKLRTSNNTVVRNGESVFYKRLNSPGWKGPGIVIGRDGQLIIVRHGGQVYRVPVCDILTLTCANDLVGTDVGTVEDTTSKEDSTVTDSNVGVNNRASVITEVSSDNENNDHESDENEDRDVVEQESNGVDNEESDGSDIEEQDSSVSEVSRRGSDDEDDQDWMSSNVLPAINSTVKFKTKEGNDWKTATILSKGGRSTGRNKHYLNIQVEGEEKPKGVFWDKHVDVWKITDNIEYLVLFTKSEELKQPVIEAKQCELRNWRKNQVYERVKNTGQKAVSSRWVMTEKLIPGSEVSKIKMRLVCRGYEEDSSMFRTDSPTCTKESLRLAVSVIMSSQWQCRSLDVRSAFLQGFEMDRQVYMRPPVGVEEKGYLWRLKRCPYGLKDAPRAWFRRVKCELDKLGVVSSVFDEALFYYKVDDKLSGIMVLHVDDFLYGGDKRFQEDVIKKFVCVFEVSIENCVNFKYIGLELVQTSDCIQINQDKYIHSLEGINVSKSRAVKRSELLTVEEKIEIKSVCGQLLWVSNNTRPDMSYETSTLCNLGSHGTVSDLLRVNKVINNMKQDKVVIKYPNLGSPDKWSLSVFSDSSFANLPDGSSQGGFIVFLTDQDGKVAPLSWQSKKLHRVTKSTLSSETLAVIEAVDSAKLSQLQIQELFGIKVPINVYTDSKSLQQTVHTSRIMTDKSQRVIIGYLRQFINNKEITIMWIDSHNQLADPLTKLGASSGQLREVLDNAKL